MRLKDRIKRLETEVRQTPALSRIVEHFTPRPDQLELLDQQTSFYESRFDGIACAISGNGAGKTYCGTAKVARFLAETPPPEHNTPFWIVSTKMDDVTKNCWAQNLSKFIPPQNIAGIRWYSEKEGLPKAVILKPHANGNNYVVEFRSYDQGRSKFQGANIIGFLCDEQCPRDILNEILARTRRWNVPGSKLYCLTPVDPDPYLEDLYADPPLSWKFFRMNTRVARDAGHVTDVFVQQIVENTLDVLVETRLTGAFAVYQGQIFKDFNQKLHVIEPFEIPRNWTVYRGIDIGWSHNTACIWVARDLQGTFYVFREYLKSQTYLDAHVAAINEGWEEFLVKGGTWIDSANAQVVAEMELKGLHAAPADKAVKAGIGTIQSLLRPNEEGKARLYIFRTCENLIRQVRTYVWDEKRLDEPKKETPTCLFDALDALRYALHSASQGTIQYKPLKQPERTRKMPF